jgi:hypothetical protein
MPKDLGDPVGPGSHNERLTAGSDLSAGDAVAIDQTSGDLEQLDTNTADRTEFAGIIRDDVSSGNEATLITAAPTGVVASTDSISAGQRLGDGGNVGQLAAESGGNALALTDAGGSYKGASLAANEAVIIY